MDSQDGEYKDNLNGSYNRESEEEVDLIELDEDDEDDEDPLPGLGGQRLITEQEFELQQSIMTLIVTPTQRTGSYPGRKTPGP